MTEPAVETLRDAYRAGWTAKARCLGRDASTKKGTRPCLQTMDLDLGTLVWTRGRDFPLHSVYTRGNGPDAPQPRPLS